MYPVVNAATGNDATNYVITDLKPEGAMAKGLAKLSAELLVAGNKKR